MSYSDCLETQRFNLPNKGKACIYGTTTLDLGEVVMEADLRLTGTLNGNNPERALCGCLRPTQVVVSELVGFWEMWGDDDEAFKFANYDPLHGHRIAVPSTKVPSEGIDSPSQHQFNEGKEKNTFVYFAQNQENDYFIATFNQTTNRITYLPIDDPSGQWRCIVYDPAEDRYLGYDTDTSELYAFDPVTGTKTLLSTITSSFDSESAVESVIINNTGYLAFDDGSTIELHRFNPSTGASLGDIDWTGTYVFSGTQFIDAINLSVLGLGLDLLNSTLHILLERSNTRYLGRVSANTLGELETAITSGTFNVTLSEFVPTDKLEALLYLNP